MPAPPDRLETLFAQATELAGAKARMDFLDAAARSDPDLLDTLTSLLEAHDTAGDFLEQPAVAEAASLVPMLLGSNLIGSMIGSWRVDSLIYSGGMGSVFRATRLEADFTQSGALKLVRVGLETDELVARFSRERQLLARVEHPHIARLLDGGATEAGLPWLAMEYVDGVAIDEYADYHRLGLAARLDLFEQLLDAISYLHENLITHRDIKAANVLVDSNGHLRVLDFGIASLLGDANASGEVIENRRLSLATAAPEQLRGQAISTATDVYALGMLLYRLISGVSPYVIDGSLSPAQLQTLICDREPPRASTALAAAADRDAKAALRETSSARLVSLLRGDLDAILKKALEKDPALRYRSVAELASDLTAYRQHRAIAARGDSTLYRSRKFLYRHWRGLAATTAVICALAVGLLIALWQAEEATRQRDRAQAMNEFMQEVLAEADPYEAGVDKRVRDVLVEASALLDRRFAGQPLLEASLRGAVGSVQLSLVDLAASEENLTRALQLLENHADGDDELRLRVEALLAWLQFEYENYDESIRRYGSVFDRLSNKHSRELRATIHNDYGLVLGELERFDEAIEQYFAAMRLTNAAQSRASTLVNLGYAYDGLGELEEAKRYYLQAIHDIREQGESGADLAHALNNYGNILSQQDRDEEALPFYLESLQVRYDLYGEDGVSVGAQHLNVGRLLLDMRRPDEALDHLDRALRILRASRGEDSIYTRVARASVARALLLTSDAREVRSRASAELASVLAELKSANDTRSARQTAQVSKWLEDARRQAASLLD